MRQAGDSTVPIFLSNTNATKGAAPFPGPPCAYLRLKGITDILIGSEKSDGGLDN
jgi:hypothetical protein